MHDIPGTDLLLVAIGRWNPSDLAYVEVLEYKAQTQEGGSEILLTSIFQRRDTAAMGWPTPQDPKVRVTIRFRGIRDFYIKEFGRHPTQIMGFDILDISEK